MKRLLTLAACMLSPLFVGLLGAPSLVHATVITAASCSRTDVNAAINTTPAVDGDTVLIPAGTCTWATQLAVTNKSITISGVAAIPQASTSSATQAKTDAIAAKNICNTPPNTTYTCITGVGISGVGGIFKWTLKLAGNSTLKNIAWLSPGGGVVSACNTYGTGFVLINGYSHTFRMTGSYINYGVSGGPGCWAVGLADAVTGVVDHNTWYAEAGATHGIVVIHDKWENVGINGNWSWAQPLTVGAAGNGLAIFIEDNTLVSSYSDNAPDLTGPLTYVTDHYIGVRFVHRFNSFMNTVVAMHGTESGGIAQRGPVQMEHYRNLFIHGPTYADGSASTPIPSAVGIRGAGTGYTFDNKIIGQATNVVGMNVYRAFGGPVGPNTSFNTMGRCRVNAVTLSRIGTAVTGVTPPGAQTGIGINVTYTRITGAGAPFDFGGADTASSPADITTTAKAFAHQFTGFTPSVLNPTTVLITTVADHGFVTGQEINIGGVSGITTSPSINDNGTTVGHSWLITVTGPKTFTFPVTSASGGPGSNGTIYNLNMFTYTASGSTGPTSSSGFQSSSLDGNSDSTGYRCLDQIGAGPSDPAYFMSGTVGGDTLAPRIWLHQPLSPHYIFNNIDAANVVSHSGTSTGTDVFIENRDYYDQNSSFNGSSIHGVGRGTRAQRIIAAPTCLTGDAWWATDGGGNWNTSATEPYSVLFPGNVSGADGGLDKCVANAWVNDAYVPYAYPHPLNVSTDTLAPAAPTGITVQ